MDFAQFERDVIAGKITDFESYFKEADENDAIELKQICIKHDAYQEAYPEWASNNDCVQYDLVDKGYCLDILIHSRNKVIRQAVIRKDIRYATEKHILAFDPDIIYSELKQILRYKNSPLSFKIIKRNGRTYLYCTFEIQAEVSDFQTRSSHGTIGLDFNKGFVTLSETNQYGHLIQTQFLPYRFKAGHKPETDFQRIACHVVELARNTGKDVCVENLDFKTKKSKTKTKSKKDRKYNEMLHSLAYRQFINSIEQRAYRHLVYVRRVNPAWTSWLAKQLYCPTMKLNTHVGASYVIARRGQGFKDAVK